MSTAMTIDPQLTTSARVAELEFKLGEVRARRRETAAQRDNLDRRRIAALAVIQDLDVYDDPGRIAMAFAQLRDLLGTTS